MPLPFFNDGLTTEQRQQLILALRAAAVHFTTEVARGRTFAQGKAEICRDIANKVERAGRFASERQLSYARSLINWAQPRPSINEANVANLAATAVGATQQQANAVQMSGVSMERIIALFAAARAAGLRYPKIRLQHGAWKCRIYPAPASSRNAGHFYVKATQGGSGRGIYCGMINAQSSRFLPTSTCPQDVITAVREFAENPVRVATAYGHATSRCCFCGLGLTDARSVAMGYGPICAGNYGLPWGEERAQQSVTLQTPAGERVMSGPEWEAAGRPEVRQAADALAAQQRQAAGLRPRRQYSERFAINEEPDNVGVRGLPSRRTSPLSRNAILERNAERNRELLRRAPNPRPVDLSRPSPTRPADVPLDEPDEDKHFM